MNCARIPLYRRWLSADIEEGRGRQREAHKTKKEEKAKEEARAKEEAADAAADGVFRGSSRA